MTIAESLQNRGFSNPDLIQKSLKHPNFKVKWNDGDRINIAFSDNSYISINRKGGTR